MSDEETQKLGRLYTAGLASARVAPEWRSRQSHWLWQHSLDPCSIQRDTKDAGTQVTMISTAWLCRPHFSLPHMVWKLRPGNSPQQKGGPTSYQPWLFVSFSASGPAQQATQCFSPVACPCICRACGDKAPLVNTELCLPSTLVLDEGITTSFFPFQIPRALTQTEAKRSAAHFFPALFSALFPAPVVQKRFRKTFLPRTAKRTGSCGPSLGQVLQPFFSRDGVKQRKPSFHSRICLGTDSEWLAQPQPMQCTELSSSVPSVRMPS